MPKSVSAIVDDETDLKLHRIEIAMRQRTGGKVRRPEALATAIEVADPAACAEHYARKLEARLATPELAASE